MNEMEMIGVDPQTEAVISMMQEGQDLETIGRQDAQETTGVHEEQEDAGVQEAQEAAGAQDARETTGTQEDRGGQSAVEADPLDGNSVTELARRIAEDEYPLGTPRNVTNVDNFEKVVDEFFAHLKEPTFTVNRTKIYPNAACVRLFPDTEYVDILIDRKEKFLALKPCDKLTSGSYHWSRNKGGKIMSVPRSGKPFVMLLCSVMGWNPNDRYQIRGVMTEDDNHEPMVAFDLLFYKHFRRGKGGENETGKDRYISDWEGRFGPTYAECKRSMRINTVQGFTVLSTEEVTEDVQPAD